MPSYIPVVTLAVTLLFLVAYLVRCERRRAWDEKTILVRTLISLHQQVKDLRDEEQGADGQRDQQ